MPVREARARFVVWVVVAPRRRSDQLAQRRHGFAPAVRGDVQDLALDSAEPLVDVLPYVAVHLCELHVQHRRQLPQSRLLGDDAGVCLDVEDRRRRVGDAAHVRHVDACDELARAQPRCHLHHVDGLAKPRERADRRIDQPVRLAVEVALLADVAVAEDHLHGSQMLVGLEQKRAQHGRLSIEVVRRHAAGDDRRLHRPDILRPPGTAPVQPAPRSGLALREGQLALTLLRFEAGSTLLGRFLRELGPGWRLVLLLALALRCCPLHEADDTLAELEPWLSERGRGAGLVSCLAERDSNTINGQSAPRSRGCQRLRVGGYSNCCERRMRLEHGEQPLPAVTNHVVL